MDGSHRLRAVREVLMFKDNSDGRIECAYNDILKEIEVRLDCRY